MMRDFDCPRQANRLPPKELWERLRKHYTVVWCSTCKTFVKGTVCSGRAENGFKTKGG